MTILVLGASGFVGSRLVQKLAQRPGAHVIAGLRRENAAFRAAGIEQRQIEATDAGSLARGLEGVRDVIHLVMGSNETMIRSTDLLVSAMEKQGCRRLVFFSSIAVYGGAEGLIDEAAPFGADVDGYGAAKIAGENRVSAARGLETVILRPGLIHGPGSEPWTARIGRLLQWRRLGDLGEAGDGYCNLITVGDVVEAAIRALEVQEAAGLSFNLADPDPPRWNRYLMDFAREIGAVPVHRLPGWQWKLERKLVAIPLKLAEIAASRARLSRLRLPDPITPSFARLMSQELRFDPGATDRVLGLGRTPYRQGLEEAARWFLSR